MQRMEERGRAERGRFYTKHLTEVILPFWLDKTDAERGGFYTCYDPSGRELVSTNKYVWSQGRCTWMYAKLAGSCQVELPPKMRKRCRQLAEQGAEFLQAYCILPDGSCPFLLSGENKPMELTQGGGYSVSDFADCFVVLGLARAGALLGREDWVLQAMELYERAAIRLKRSMFRTAPSVLPYGWRSHAPAMIMVNTGEELSEALRSLGRGALGERVDGVIRWAMDDIAEHFMSRTGIVYEYLSAENQPLHSLYGRHINPGHTNESMWFLMQSATRLGRADIVERAMYIIKNTSELAWDKEYGGMMYYLDREGGRPRGTEQAKERELAEAVVRDWSKKLWWPHTETIYANLLCYVQTGQADFLAQYERYHDYTFNIFPNPDRVVGEWIQLRKRDGSPCQGAIGGRLPVKDPYHITRNLVLLIELLSGVTAPCVENLAVF